MVRSWFSRSHSGLQELGALALLYGLYEVVRGVPSENVEAAMRHTSEIVDLERFIDAVRRVGEGGSALDPEVVSRLLGRRRQEDPLAEISPRERQVLALMAEGRSNHAIATELVVTERAVEKHVTSIFTKLRLPAAREDHRRVLAVLRFLGS